MVWHEALLWTLLPHTGHSMQCIMCADIVFCPQPSLDYLPAGLPQYLIVLGHGFLYVCLLVSLAPVLWPLGRLLSAHSQVQNSIGLGQTHLRLATPFQVHVLRRERREFRNEKTWEEIWGILALPEIDVVSCDGGQRKNGKNKEKWRDRHQFVSINRIQALHNFVLTDRI